LIKIFKLFDGDVFDRPTSLKCMRLCFFMLRY